MESVLLNLRERQVFAEKEYPLLRNYGERFLLRHIEGTGGTGDFLADVRMMGMGYDAPYIRFVMSHYVGTDWIDKKRKLAMVVRPEESGVDVQRMLMGCFRRPDGCNLDDIIYIRTDDEPIETQTDDFQLEPLLIVYFLNLMQRIVSRGLKSDYVEREEQLEGRIKGKIVMGRYITHGIATGRRDKVNCYFEEYGVNCLENRILKSAHKLVRQLLWRNSKALGEEAAVLEGMYAYCETAFAGVGDDVSLQDLRRVHVHPSFKDYRAIMPLAKMIIRKQGTRMFPPFIIDMSALRERTY